MTARIKRSRGADWDATRAPTSNHVVVLL